MCYIGASFIDSVTIADKVKVCEAKDLSRLNSSVYSKMPAYSGDCDIDLINEAVWDVNLL